MTEEQKQKEIEEIGELIEKVMGVDRAFCLFLLNHFKKSGKNRA